MKRLMTAVCCACSLGVAAVSAVQSNSMDKDMKATTMTGCLVEKGGRFTLEHAMKPSDMKDDIKHGDKKATTYGLMGGALQPHAGHQVEVTGIMDSRVIGTAKMATDPKTDKDNMSLTEMAGTINVTSVKMLSATCP
jgi:hypothetical protein